MQEERNILRKDLLSKKETSTWWFGKFSGYPDCKRCQCWEIHGSESMLWKEGQECGCKTFAEEIRCITHGSNRQSQQKPGIERGYPGMIHGKPSHLMEWTPFTYMEDWWGFSEYCISRNIATWTEGDLERSEREQLDFQNSSSKKWANIDSLWQTCTTIPEKGRRLWVQSHRGRKRDERGCKTRGRDQPNCHPSYRSQLSHPVGPEAEAKHGASTGLDSISVND